MYWFSLYLLFSLLFLFALFKTFFFSLVNSNCTQLASNKQINNKSKNWMW